MFFLDVFTTTGACVSLASLHRLPIDSRIQYKLASVCYNCLNSTHLGNLTELLRREEIRSVCLNNGLNESSGFMSDTSRENSRARKRETTQCNTVKFSQPRPNIATPTHLNTSRPKSVKRITIESITIDAYLKQEVPSRGLLLP